MRLILVDDDQMITQSLEVILNCEPDIEIIGIAHDGSAAIEAVKHEVPDMVLMDISMPKMNGILATIEIKKLYPKVKIVMLTTFLDFKHVMQSLQAGADGYMLKTDPYEQQLETIRMISKGHSVVSSQAMKKLSEVKVEDDLTPRENEILRLVAQGLNNKEISQTLYMGEGTIRNMISVILEKLELRDRTQLAIYYWQQRT